MAETEGVEIPQGFIDNFIMQGPESAPEEISAVREVSLGIAENTMQIFWEAFDEGMKQRGGSGIGKLQSTDLAKLSRLSLEDLLPAHVIENSPHYALGMCVTTLIGQNYVAIRRNQKKQQKQPTETERTREENG